MKNLVPTTERTSDVKIQMLAFLDEILPEGYKILEEPVIGYFYQSFIRHEAWQMVIKKTDNKLFNVVYYLKGLSMVLEERYLHSRFVKLHSGTIISDGKIGTENNETVLYCQRPKPIKKVYEINSATMEKIDFCRASVL